MGFRISTGWRFAAGSLLCARNPDRSIHKPPVGQPAIEERQRESHRQFDSQGQYHRARRWPALCRSHSGKLPSRQGHANDPDRHAPDFGRREDDRPLQDDRAGRARLRRGPRIHLPLQGRRRLPFHEFGDLRPGDRAAGRDRRPGDLSPGKHEGHAEHCSTASPSPSSCRRVSRSKSSKPSRR